MNADEPLVVEVTSGRIHRGGDELNLSSKTIELLTALAVEARPVARDILLARLWPDQGSDSTRNALKMCVHRARRQVGDKHAVLVGHGLYRLGDRVITDIARVAAISDAMRDRRAEVRSEARLIFNSLRAGRPSTFAHWEWFAPFEQRLEAITADLGLSLARAALEVGDVESSLAYASALADLDPCDEAATEIMIRAHLKRGERPLAISKFRRLARSLRDELDVEPSYALRALLERQYYV
ncbi:MAG: AfsR/SARP family transcriptional regulator [Vulcanimicrobiaceae bacterium]